MRIIGAGNIGSALAREAESMGLAIEVADARPERAKALAEEIDGDLVDVDARLEEVDLVIEAASQPAVAGPVIEALRRGVDCMVLTTGALIQADLLEEATQAMEKTQARCYLPSGGVAGLDAVKALALEEGASVRLTTRKPPASLGLTDDEAGELFRGTATEAVRQYPKNVNVSATLTLAGLSPEVTIVADPDLDRNTHQIEVESPNVRVTVTVESDPSDINPATSQVAVLSARALLRKLADPMQVGT